MAVRVLPPEVAARIAAGEVIERPASVVKELVENAIDAGATRVAVQVERGGLGLIRVTDDGRGMSVADLALAPLRHATSKLGDDADLGRITTLGFRGEALPSIVAAADLEITTRPAGSAAGAAVRSRDGGLEAVRAAACATGTTVSVRDLFARQPARRKFLRTPAAESAQVARAVTHYALAYPEIAFTLTLDGRRSLVTSGSGDARDAVTAVYGPATAAAMLEVAAEGPAAAVGGLVAPPEVSRSTRAGITVFINRRWVQHRRLVYAVESAFDTLLMTGRYPLAVLDLRVDAAEVDVNVHPAKTEVRLRAENEVFRLVHGAVRDTLVRSAPVAGFTPPASGDIAPTWRLPEPQSLPRPVTPLPEPTHGAVSGAVPPAPRLILPVLRVIGQIGSTYIIAEGPEGMYLIDQHAAHERVLYERIARARAERAPESQALLAPLPFEPTPAQATALAEYAADLAALGFSIDDFGERSVLVRAIPAALAGRDVVRALTEFLDGVLEGGAPPDRAERAAMTLACHAAVRAGAVLAPEEMRDLVRQLEGCAAPRTCPHGRPTMVHVSAAALEREFGRRG